MRVLLTFLPGTGSLNPLVPLAQALYKAGHEVGWCSSESLRPEAEATGFPFFAAGVNYKPEPRHQIMCALAGIEFPDLTGKERYAWVVNHIFAGIGSRQMAPDVISISRDWGASLIVRESLEFSGCAAAESLGIPHASVGSPANSALDMRSQLEPALAKLRESVGLPPDSAVEMPYRNLHLCFSPPSFDGPNAVFAPNTRFIRHENPPRPGEQLPAWMSDLTDQPTVLASLGTVFNGTPGLLESILAGLRDEPINLILAVGRDRDPSDFGPQPANVHIERYVPQTLLLPLCRLFVTHAGFNSVKEALSVGVPMVVIPIGGDQHYSAERCIAIGVAEAIEPEERRPELIRDAVRTVLANGSYGERAGEMRGEIALLPDIGTAVELLEGLV